MNYFDIRYLFNSKILPFNLQVEIALPCKTVSIILKPHIQCGQNGPFIALWAKPLDTIIWPKFPKF